MTSSTSNSAFIYLDEAGDLGWKFSAPYGRGGSSRYLAISAVLTPNAKRHLPKRTIQKICKDFGWSNSEEHKWCSMDPAQRTHCAVALRSLADVNPDIILHAIVVKKQNVSAQVHGDSLKLYNFMVRAALLKTMAQHSVVTLIPDARNTKNLNGNSLHDYLQTELWFAEEVETKLVTTPLISAACKGIQLADILAGIVHSHFEDKPSCDFETIRPKLNLKQLSFQKPPEAGTRRQLPKSEFRQVSPLWRRKFACFCCPHAVLGRPRRRLREI